MQNLAHFSRGTLNVDHSPLSAAAGEGGHAAQVGAAGVDLGGLALAAIARAEIPGKRVADGVHRRQHLEGVAGDGGAPVQGAELAVLDRVGLADDEPGSM